jgi:hypothetical protein
VNFARNDRFGSLVSFENFLDGVGLMAKLHRVVASIATARVRTASLAIVK